MILGPNDRPPKTELQRAQDRSKGCAECGGTGLTSRTQDRDLGGGEVRPVSVSCYCPRCDAGKELYSHHSANCPELRGKILWIKGDPDLEAGDYDRMTPAERAHYLAVAQGFLRGRGSPLRSVDEGAAEPEPLKVHRPTPY